MMTGRQNRLEALYVLITDWTDIRRTDTGALRLVFQISNRPLPTIRYLTVQVGTDRFRKLHCQRYQFC